jgi:hypothetical protein
MSSRASPTPTTLRGHWLLFARLAWVAVAVTVLAIVVFSVPGSFEHFRSVCTAAFETCSKRAVGQPTPEGVRALQDVGLSVGTYAILNVVVDKVADSVWIAVGALIFLRRSDDRMALLVSLFLVTFGTIMIDSTDVNILLSSQPAWWLPIRCVQVVGSVCSMLFFLLFPGGRFVPRWTRWLAVAFIAFQVPRDLFPDLYSRSPALEGISFMVFLGIVVSITWSLAYRYRRISSVEQRRQTRWVVFGTALAIAGSFPFQLPIDLYLIGGDTPLVLLLFKIGFTLSFLLIPLSVGVAVVSLRLFDIDVLINRTLVYGLLTAMLIGLYFGGILVLQRLFVVLTGEKSTLAVVASTLVIAALFNPLRQRTQSFIDRRFYRRKYDARKTLDEFSATLRDETDLDALSDDLVGVVRETMQPEHVTLWLRPRADANRGTKERAG